MCTKISFNQLDHNDCGIKFIGEQIKSKKLQPWYQVIPGTFKLIKY